MDLRQLLIFLKLSLSKCKLKYHNKLLTEKDYYATIKLYNYLNPPGIYIKEMHLL